MVKKNDVLELAHDVANASRSKERELHRVRDLQHRLSSRWRELRFAFENWEYRWDRLASAPKADGVRLASRYTRDLRAALERIVKAIQALDLLPDLEKTCAFDPSYCMGTPYEEPAVAIKITIKLLNAVVGGADSKSLVKALQLIVPVPCFRGVGYMVHLLEVARRWPNRCSCGKIVEPPYFLSAHCSRCRAVEDGSVFHLWVAMIV